LKRCTCHKSIRSLQAELREKIHFWQINMHFPYRVSRGRGGKERKGKGRSYAAVHE
jgi:hypothetical protein